MYKFFQGVPIVPIGTELTLDKNKCMLIEELGKIIYNNSIIYNCTDKMTGYPTLETQTIGLGGKFAFYMMHNIDTKFLLNTDIKENENDIFIVLQSSITVLTKTNKKSYNNLKLLVDVRKENSKVNLYALMIGKLPTFKFMGFFPMREIVKRQPHDFGRGDCFFATQSELMNYEDCINYIIDH